MERVTAIGELIKKRWQELADSYKLDIDLWGIPALSGFTFRSSNALAYKTLITQEMLRQGFLAGNSVYVCTQHTPQIIDQYFDALEPIFALIKDCEEGLDPMSLLEGPVCHSSFKRLN